MTTLYIKTHNITGLKYFGKTTKQGKAFESYQGSGVYWQRHIKKHGYDVTTEIYSQFEDDDPQLILISEEFSKLNNIVESEEWANLVPENGLDGGQVSEQSVKKMLDTRKMKINGKTSYETGGQKCLETKRQTVLSDGRTLLQATVDKTAETRRLRGDFEKMSQDFSGWETGTCEICGVTTNIGNIKRWHNENCKHNNQSRRKVKICPHCGKTGTNNMSRYHFDNCKFK